MKAIVLRLDAPMMSFGGVIVDQHGFTEYFPGTAMLAGLFANALGWDHRNTDDLQQLQERIRYAARWDVHPDILVDYQTVDLGQPKMRGSGWTSRGRPEHRAGGSSAKFGIHQRYRHYWVDGLLTLAVGLTEGFHPNVHDLKEALNQPARPLFIGRKTCIPSRPLLDPQTPLIQATDLLDAIRKIPVWDRNGTPTESDEPLLSCWPADLGHADRGEVRRVYDRRDWVNQIPSGDSRRVEGLL